MAILQFSENSIKAFELETHLKKKIIVDRKRPSQEMATLLCPPLSFFLFNCFRKPETTEI